MASGLFQRNPRNVRIAAWVLAGSVFALWWRHDQQQQRTFTDAEAQQWNQDVLARTGTKSEKQRGVK